MPLKSVEERLQYHREYYIKHRDEQLKQAKIRGHRVRDPVKNRLYNAKYYILHKESECHKQKIIYDKKRNYNVPYLLNMLGGKCVSCSTTSTLHFHHINPTTKLFSIREKCGNYKLDKLIPEAQKCALMCKKCHQLVNHTILSKVCELIGMQK